MMQNTTLLPVKDIIIRYEHENEPETVKYHISGQALPAEEDVCPMSISHPQYMSTNKLIDMYFNVIRSFMISLCVTTIEVGACLQYDCIDNHLVIQGKS